MSSAALCASLSYLGLEVRLAQRLQLGRKMLKICMLEVLEACLAATIAREDPAVLVAEALACRDEADLPARLEARRRAGRA